MIVNDYHDGYPAYSHQSYSHQVGMCHNDEEWEYDTVKFPPSPYNDKYNDEGWGVSSDKTSGTPQTPSRHLQIIPRHPPDKLCVQFNVYSLSLSMFALLVQMHQKD